MVDKFRRWLCSVEFHDAYMTRALPGYDLKCRVCGLVRYPDGWAEFDPMRTDDGKTS